LLVRVFDRQKDLKLDKSSIRALVRETLAYLGIAPQEVSLYFVSTKMISDLHLQFFNDPATTDCISFPLDSSTLGEVFVCPKTAIDYAAKNNLDPYEEVKLYIIHGLLHLIGYDDLEPKKRSLMRKKEKSCMGQVKVQLRPK
jgi:probable rRNA maturation factor